MNLLEQARALLGPSLQAQDQEQMNALIEIARAFSEYDAKRSFEILDPLIDQVNDLCAAARTLEDLVRRTTKTTSSICRTGTACRTIVTQMSNVLGTLALVNFERAQSDGRQDCDCPKCDSGFTSKSRSRRSKVADSRR